MIVDGHAEGLLHDVVADDVAVEVVVDLLGRRRKSRDGLHFDALLVAIHKN